MDYYAHINPSRYIRVLYCNIYFLLKLRQTAALRYHGTPERCSGTINTFRLAFYIAPEQRSGIQVLRSRQSILL
jgi:hypothetical protein